MINELENAAKSMQNKIYNIQIVANNLANLDTAGFKRQIPFSEYMERFENKDVKQITDFEEGVFMETGSAFDLAISGDAFLAVNTDRGVEITKNGQLKIDSEGYLATKNGNRVLGNGGEINLEEAIFDSKDKITITSEGHIKLGDLQINSLRLVTPENPKMLIRTENQNFYEPDENYKNAEINKYQIHQGFLESSNTNPIFEMQSMIQLQKDFETAQKIISSLDAVMSQNKEIGKV